MSRTKRIMSLVMTLVFMFTTAMMTGMTAFAANPRDIWYVGWEDDTYQAYIGWTGNSGKFSVDTENYYKDSRYSLKLSNEDYNSAYITKEVDVEPLTTYRFSAMVKYSGYMLDPNAEIESAGARLSAKIPLTAKYYGNTSWYNGKGWAMQELTFTTLADQTEVELMLWNGAHNGFCKGTAWFSDVKLEKVEFTNQWNVLAVIFKNADVNVDLNGRTTSLKTGGEGLTHYKKSIDKAGINKITSAVNKTIDTIERLSGGLMGVADVDVVSVDAPVTELKEYRYDGDQWGTGAILGYQLDKDSDCVTKALDKYLAKKQYHQIIVFSTLSKITGGWYGIGGGDFNGVNFCQVAYGDSFNPENHEITILGIVHEMMHCIEHDSRAMYGDLTPNLHSAPDFKYENGTEKWYSAYLKAELPDGKGIQPKAYWYPSGEYTLISDDMTAGGLVDTSALPLKLSKVKATKIKDQFYTGKSIKPDVVLKDGNYTLKKNVDYTLSYTKNKSVGTATVTIKGKGIYTGTKKVTFKIVKKPLSTEALTVKATKTSSKIKVSWNKAEGAEKYVVWVSKNGKDFKKYKEYSSKTTSMAIKYNSKTEYQFAVTAYIPELGQYTNYGYSDVV